MKGRLVFMWINKEKRTVRMKEGKELWWERSRGLLRGNRRRKSGVHGKRDVCFL